MGNAFGFLYGKCCKPTTSDESLGPQAVPVAPVGVTVLAHDLLNFEVTSQVPDGLGKYVVSSKKAQANWYRKILEAWKQAKPPPQTAEDAAKLVLETLNKQQKADVEGFLSFYGLPLLDVSSEDTVSLPEGILFKFHTLPVDPKAVADGDGMTVYVNALDPVVSSSVPKEVNLAVVKRAKAREKKNYEKADEFHQKIINSGFRVLNIKNEEVLARKFRIRLRGIDAPEIQMPYGKESQDELIKIIQWKTLKVLVYGEDQYGRLVSDIYCNGVFVQEAMLKKGLVWHYITYDKRLVLAKWEKEARKKRIGLWASDNPEKPWEWRKNNRR